MKELTRSELVNIREGFIGADAYDLERRVHKLLWHVDYIEQQLAAERERVADLESEVAESRDTYDRQTHRIAELQALLEARPNETELWESRGTYHHENECLEDPLPSGVQRTKCQGHTF